MTPFFRKDVITIGSFRKAFAIPVWLFAAAMLFIPVCLASQTEPLADYPAEDSYYIKADDKKALVYELERFVFNQLDRRTALFAVTVEGPALQELSVKALSEGTDTLLTGDIVERYLQTRDKDYNAHLLSDYNATVQYWCRGIRPRHPVRVMVIYSVGWSESAEQTRAVYAYAKEQVKRLLAPGMSHFERIKTLHDFVVNEYSYEPIEKNYADSSICPYRMLQSGAGVCNAYSGLMYQLLNAAGYRARIILKGASAVNADGGREPHAWNMVEIEGVWYHIDATWDDPLCENGEEYLLHDYFLKSDSYIQKTHAWDQNAYPAAPASFALSKAGHIPGAANVYTPVVDLTALPEDICAGKSGPPPLGLLGYIESFWPGSASGTLWWSLPVLAAALLGMTLLRGRREKGGTP